MFKLDKKELNSRLKTAGKDPLKREISAAADAVAADPSSQAFYTVDVPRLLMVPLDGDQSDLDNWHKMVPAALRQNRSSVAPLLLRLLAGIEGAGNSLTDLSFWKQYGAQQNKAQQEHLRSLVAGFAPQFPLEAATESQLRATVGEAQLAEVSSKDLAKLARESGVHMFPDLELPEGGLPRNVAKVLKAALAEPDYRTAFDVLLLHRPNDVKGIRVVDELLANEKPITVQDAAKAYQRAETASDSSALPRAKHLLGQLRPISDLSQLREVLLSTLVYQAEQMVKAGTALRVARDRFVGWGIDAADATRVVLSISTGGGPAAGPGAGDIRQALAAASLDEAIRLVEVLENQADEDPEIAEAVDMVARARERYAESLREFDAAVARRDFAVAAELLDTARRIDANEEVEAKFDAIPPAPASQVEARASATDEVHVRWFGALRDGDSYTVVRGSRPAASLSDGTQVASSLVASQFVDKDAPIAENLVYTVFAVRAGNVSSDPVASTSVRILPAPKGLQAETTEDAASVSWNRIANASGYTLSLQDPQGHTQQEHVAGTSTVFRNLRTGVRYQVAVAATYYLDGATENSTWSTAQFTPRGVASPVNNLQATTVGASTLELRWTEPAGFEVQIWQMPASFTLPDQRLVPAAYLAESGKRLSTVSKQTDSAGYTVAQVSAPEGVRKFVPATVVNDDILLGYPVLAGVAPKPEGIESRLLGEDLQLSFIWPEGNYTALVNYQRNGRKQTEKFSRVDYRRNSGLVIRDVANVQNIALTLVADVAGQRLHSVAVPVEFSAPVRNAEVHYNLHTKRSLFGGKYTVTITARSDETREFVSGQLKIKFGPVMPLDESDGDTVASVPLDFSTANQISETVELGKLTAPFWLQLTAPGSAVQIIHPHTQELKVTK